jgi:hypothetical protein
MRWESVAVLSLIREGDLVRQSTRRSRVISPRTECIHRRNTCAGGLRRRRRSDAGEASERNCADWMAWRAQSGGGTPLAACAGALGDSLRQSTRRSRVSSPARKLMDRHKARAGDSCRRRRSDAGEASERNCADWMAFRARCGRGTPLAVVSIRRMAQCDRAVQPTFCRCPPFP